MSVRVNLLPYREESRKAAKRQLSVLAAGMAGLGLSVALLVHGAIAGYVSVQESRNDFLKAETAALDKKIADIKTLQSDIEALKARKNVIESLQADRSAAVQMLEEMVKVTPDGVYFKSLKQTGLKVTITGYAQGNELVSDFMRNIQASKFLEKPQLIEIKAAKVGERKLSEFSLAVYIFRPKDETKAEEKPEPKKGKAKPATKS